MAITVLLVWNSWYSYNEWQKACENTQNEEHWNESNALFEKIYPMIKGNGRFLIMWSSLQYRMGNKQESLSLLKDAEHFFCDDVFLKNMAILYEETGQIAEARQSFDKAVNIVPGTFNIAYERILFLQRIGEYREAYMEALKLYNKPVRSSYYVDPFIIKVKLRKIIQSYQENQINK